MSTKLQLGMITVTMENQDEASISDVQSGGTSGYSGYSGRSGLSGYSGISGYSDSGLSGFSGPTGLSGFSGYSDSRLSGFSGPTGPIGISGLSGFSGHSDSGLSGFSGSGASIILTNYGETTFSITPVGNAATFDIANGNVQTCTVSGIVTWTFSNPRSNGTACTITLFLTNGGTGDQTWPGGTKWSGGKPTLTAAGVDILSFMTYDGGTTWYGVLAGANFV